MRDNLIAGLHRMIEAEGLAAVLEELGEAVGSMVENSDYSRDSKLASIQTHLETLAEKAEGL